MDRTKLKTYAPQARRDFIQAMKSRAALFGITGKGIAPATLQGDTVIIQGQAFTKAVEGLRQRLAAQIEREGFEQVMEAMAYTWFNRFAALRFMELHGYLDHGYRVLSHPEGKSIPEILEQAEHVDLPGLKREQVVDLKLEGKEQDLYRLLLVSQCNALYQAMPFLFEAIEDETELLLPDNLLHSDSLIRKLVSNLDAEDCESVEILGWLYQFYIADKKDAVMARKTAVPTEDIPAVTQLFTPHWIVRYLVENSLGRLWLLNRPGSRLREHMPYYIEGEQETDFLRITRPEDIRLLDPAVGSGHMLIYAFDVLYLIYEEEGYAPAEIPGLILRHNLFGLEICPRAAQLAGLALVLKAREKNRRFFQPEYIVQPNIIELRDVRFAENELRDYIQALNLGDLFNQPMLTLLHQFEEAKNFGSLIQPCLDEQSIAYARSAIEARDLAGQLFLRETHLKVLRVLEQAEALTQRYHVVVANPPYFGPKQMGAIMKDFAKAHFPNSKTDLYAMFIERAFSIAKNNGYCALVTMQSWMFLHSFESFRIELLSTKTILSMAHLGARAFDTISGEIVTVTAFCCANRYLDGHKSIFFRLVDGNETIKDEALRERKHCYSQISQKEFAAVPGNPVAYWIGERVKAAFKNRQVFDLTISDGQNITADNERFVRNHWEVSSTSIGKGRKWLLYAKGGPFRRWYGNLESVVDWSPEARAHFRKDSSARIIPEYLWYRQGITWSRVGTALAGFRLLPENATFDKVGSSVFLKSDDDTNLLLGLLNSPLAQTVLDLLNPSIDIQIKDVRNVPLANDLNRKLVDELVSPLVASAKADWDNFETSWGFRDQPLLRPGLKGATLEVSWRNWEAQSTTAIRRMQELETENNRLFIAAYGLDGELQPEVPEEQITLARADVRKDMAAFLSDAVGCMMGRYRLDKPGLIYAHGGNVGFREIYEGGDRGLGLGDRGLGIGDRGQGIGDRGQGVGDRGEGYECAELSGFGGVAEGDGSGRAGLFGDQGVSTGGIVRADQSGEASSGISSIQHRRGTLAQIHSRVSPLPFDSPGFESGSGNPGADLNPSQIPNPGASHTRSAPSRGTLQNAPLPALQAPLTPVPCPLSPNPFPADEDGIVPVTEFAWFPDDAATRFETFVKTLWPAEILEENLAWVAESLDTKKDDTPRDTIRRYFATGFYKDHLQTYKKRPIYWLFSSGMERAFQALVYLHRYHEGTLARMRTEYVIPLQGRISGRIKQLPEDIARATSTAHGKKLQKELDTLKKQQVELHTFDEKLRHQADLRIKLDLDDGVKVNYGKFGDLLAEVKAITGGAGDE